jgi:Sperm-tail PG-rich repeat
MLADILDSRRMTIGTAGGSYNNAGREAHYVRGNTKNQNSGGSSRLAVADSSFIPAPASNTENVSKVSKTFKLDPVNFLPMQKTRETGQKESLRDWMKRARDQRKQNPQIVGCFIGTGKIDDGSRDFEIATRNNALARAKRNGLGFGPNYIGRNEHYRSLQDVRINENSPPQNQRGGKSYMNQTIDGKPRGGGFFDRKLSSQAPQEGSTVVPAFLQQYSGQFSNSHQSMPKEKVPCIVFSTGNQLVTPGPDAYDVKVGNISDKLQKGFGITFKGRNIINKRSADASPGPADYSPDITLGGTQKNAFSIGKAPKNLGSLERIQKSPGPGAYDGDKLHRIKGTVIFDSITRSNSVDNTPGPGHYDTSLLLKRRVPKMPFPTAPRFQHFLKEKLQANVGPNSYNPIYEAAHPRRTGVKFGTETRSTGLTKPSAMTYSTGSLLEEGSGHMHSKTQANFASSSNILLEKHVPAVPFSAEKRFKKNIVVML